MTVAVVDHAILLAAWWALWTLADAYLIRFTPFSEVAVLAGAGMLALARAWWTRAAAACSGVLSEATQTAPAPARRARAYEKQGEVSEM